jgi:hypothetical protein
MDFQTMAVTGVSDIQVRSAGDGLHHTTRLTYNQPKFKIICVCYSESPLLKTWILGSYFVSGRKEPLWTLGRGWDSSVSIKTRLGAGWPGFNSRRKNDVIFSFPHCVQTGPGPPSILPNGYRNSFTRCKAVGAWSWPLTSTLPTSLHGVMLN